MSRADWRARVRETSLDEVILEEMIRHGFWDAGAPAPDLSDDFFARRRELQAEITDIVARDRHLSDPDKALAEVMKERMRQARLRRVETKRQEIEARNARGRAFDKKRRETILTLGDTPSAPLQKTGADTDKLAANDLPLITSALDLASAMGIALGELKFLTFDRKVAQHTHYQTFEIPKKTGGTRQISAPKPRLKRAQYWVLDNILAQLEPHDAAHGFRAGRSIVTNATPHVGQQLVINMDLKDFFPTITYPRVKGLFAGIGFAESEAALLALICTEADREEIEIDGTVWKVATGPRKTPQGAPTSPAIANLIAHRLDRRLTGLAKHFGLTYTRYADDLTFSGDRPSDKGVKAFHKAVQDIVADEGFALHPDKTRFMGKGQRQEVTGLVVNDKVSVPRDERRKFRAWLHQSKQAGGPTRAFRAGNPVTSGQGYASFLHMVGGTEGMALAEKAWLVLGRTTGVTSYDVEAAQEFRTASANGRDPKPDWWQPAEKPPFDPIPLPAFDRKDQQVQDSVSGIPTSGRPRRPTRAPSQTRDPVAGQVFATEERPFGAKLFYSILALGAQILPGIGSLLTLVLLYFIWRPRAGYANFETLGGKLIVLGRLFLGMIGLNIVVGFSLIIILSIMGLL